MGIRVGIIFLFVLMGVGIGSIILASPKLHFALKSLGACYLIYLALKVAFTKEARNSDRAAKPISFKQGTLLQFINPKSMMMVLSCIAAFSLPGPLYLISMIQACVVFTLVGTLSNSCWALFGVSINRLLSTQKAKLIFNRTLALLTLCAVALLF